MADFSKHSLAQLGSHIRQAVDVDGSPVQWVNEAIKKELVGRVKTRMIAEHLLQFHSDTFRKNSSNERFDELYAIMVTLQAMDSPIVP